jgi:hypothetical protein
VNSSKRQESTSASVNGPNIVATFINVKLNILS